MSKKNIENEIKNMGLYEKLDLIEAIGDSGSSSFTGKNSEFLKNLSHDEEGEVRAKVAEILVLSNSSFTEKILINLLKDKDELVRIHACDSLCVSNSCIVINHLKDRVLKDKSSLVRGYAALSIGDIASNRNCDFKELEVFFTKVLAKERVNWVKLNFYKALYLIGDESYLDLLISELKNRSYRSRCLIVNILSDLVSKHNLFLIRTALTERLEIEKTVAVRSTIEKTLLILEENIKGK